MNRKIEVAKVSIRVGEITLELTVDEAKELKDMLNATFPVSAYPVYVGRPVYVGHDSPYRHWIWDTTTPSETIITSKAGEQ